MRQTILALACLGAVSACSTFEGVGKDIQAVGNGVSHLANEARDEMFGHRQVAEVRYGDACDPYADELDGGSGLPPCDSTAPTPRRN